MTYNRDFSTITLTMSEMMRRDARWTLVFNLLNDLAPGYRVIPDYSHEEMDIADIKVCYNTDPDRCEKVVK